MRVTGLGEEYLYICVSFIKTSFNSGKRKTFWYHRPLYISGVDLLKKILLQRQQVRSYKTRTKIQMVSTYGVLWSRRTPTHSLTVRTRKKRKKKKKKTANYGRVGVYSIARTG